MAAKFKQVFEDLITKAAQHNFKGIDPYDFASSKLKLPGALLSKVSFLNKVSPVNFRFLLGIKPSNNSKSNALFLQAMVNYDCVKYNIQIDYLYNWLLQNKSPEFKEFSVGFAFEMTLSRYQSGPGKTSLIISLFAIFAFVDYYKQAKKQEILEHILSFESLLAKYWPKYETEDSLWYSYLSSHKDEVYNATAKVGKFYAILYELQPEENYKEKIKKILYYLEKVQNSDGSWGYSTKVKYTDNFHTAFVLESIYEMHKVYRDEHTLNMFKKGFETYKQFCFKGFRPLHFHIHHKPKDIRSKILRTEIRDGANATIFFSTIGDTAFANGILNWLQDNYYNKKKSYYYFFDNKFFTSKINYIRWQAWMALAIATFSKAKEYNSK